MASKAAKLLERMRQSKTNWKRGDIVALYEGFGFIISSGRKHDIVKHPDFPELRETLPRHTKLPKSYVADAVKLVDRYLNLKRDKEADND